MEDLFITINNANSEKYFTNNTPYNFQVCLDNQLDLDDNYECALVDFTCKTGKIDSRFQHIFIYFNMVEEQPVGSGRDSLIRHTIVQGSKLQMEKFKLPYYMSVKQLKTNILEVYIKDEDGEEASFLKQTTTCTFHFRKKSWRFN